MGKKMILYFCLALVWMALAGTGCGKEAGTSTAEGVTPAGAGTPGSGVPGEGSGTPEPGEGSAAPAPTHQAVATGTPVPTKSPTPVPTKAEPMPTQEAKLVTVTPVPGESVREIVGSIAAEDYPVVDGSTATLPLSQALYALATGRDMEEAERAVVHTKTTNSYYRLYDKEADLLIVYEPPQEVINRMREENLLIKPIGLDALVFMANAGNTVQSLTTQQLVDIYAGRIKNWAEVGGSDQRLLAFQRPAGSGSQTLMQKLVMGEVPMEEGDNIFRYHTMADILEGMLAYTGEANTLGYSVFYYANFMYSLPQLRFMGVNGVTPSTQTIYDGTYPFVNAFYAVIRPDEREDSNARILFDWLTGEEGQQMVLDLGYVPVVMPDGAQITAKDPVREEELLLTPKQKLAPGEHFIFVQEEPSPDYNDHGDIRIYDENWECCASFRTASCTTQGVTDARYVYIGRWRAGSEDGEDRWSETVEDAVIYDLKENEFLDFSTVTDGYVTILDGVRGYFECTQDSDKAKVIDRDGKVLLDDIQMGEGGGMIYRQEDYFTATYWEGHFGDNKGDVKKIFDLDLNLTSVIFEHPEDLPAASDRAAGVGYAVSEDGYVLSPEGEILLDKDIFLARFGNGEDTECTIGNKYPLILGRDTPEYLYRVEYAGEIWYVDITLNVYFREGETQLTVSDPKKALCPYYMAKTEDSTKYFSPDGSLIVQIPSGETGRVLRSAGESYILAEKSGDGFVVDIIGQQEDDHQTYQYGAEGIIFNEIQYPEPQMVILYGSRVGEARTQQEVLAICQGSSMELLEAERILLRQVYSEKQGQDEKVWLAELYHGSQAAGGGLAYTYVLLGGGKIRFMTPEPGRLVRCHDGYLQVDAGSYTYVYDYDGNQIIKAYNRLLMDE